MKRQLAVALRTTLVTLLLTGLAYPLAMTEIAQLIAGHAANGSFVHDERGRVVGSEVIGQTFRMPAYFQSRPSAAGSGYDAANSGGSNLGPTSKKLRQRVEQELERLRAENPDAPPSIPVELVTASASGLDPHLSPEAARWQISRVVRARGIQRERVEEVVASNIEGRTFGLLGEPRLNVLLLNLALDRRFGRPSQP